MTLGILQRVHRCHGHLLYQKVISKLLWIIINLCIIAAVNVGSIICSTSDINSDTVSLEFKVSNYSNIVADIDDQQDLDQNTLHTLEVYNQPSSYPTQAFDEQGQLHAICTVRYQM